jgi:hypothetical protein
MTHARFFNSPKMLKIGLMPAKNKMRIFQK